MHDSLLPLVTRSRERAPVFRFEAMALEVRVLVSTEESGGAQSITEFLFDAPFAGPPLHWHRSFSETFVALDGEFILVTGDEERVMRPGDVAHVPPGILHSYRVDGPGRVRYLLVCAPGSQFEKYVAEAATLAAEAHRHHRPVDLEVMRDLRGRHQTYERDVPFF